GRRGEQSLRAVQHLEPRRAAQGGLDDAVGRREHGHVGGQRYGSVDGGAGGRSAVPVVPVVAVLPEVPVDEPDHVEPVDELFPPERVPVFSAMASRAEPRLSLADAVAQSPAWRAVSPASPATW